MGVQILLQCMDGAAGAQGTGVSFPLLAAAATTMLHPELAGELQTMLPLATLWCQGFLRSLKMCAFQWLGLPLSQELGQGISFFPSPRTTQRTTSLKNSYGPVVSTESPGQPDCLGPQPTLLATRRAAVSIFKENPIMTPIKALVVVVTVFTCACGSKSLKVSSLS